MPTNSYLPFAIAAGANVWSDATYSGSSQQQTGIQKGIVPSGLMSKAWRQSSVPASALAQVIVDHGLIDAPDDGNVAGFKTNLRMAISAMLAGVAFAVDQSTTANVITAILDPAPPSLSTYRGVFIRVANTNTGGVTLALNNLGSKALVRKNGLALAAGDIVAGQIVHVIYDLAQGQWVLAGLSLSDILANLNQVGAIPQAKTQLLTTGAGTFQVPVGVYILRRVRIWGAGGGGGGAASSASAASGGGPGAYWEGAIPVMPGQQIAYTVGAGGIAGAGGASPTGGGTGGTTTFGSFVTCPGATGGLAANGGVQVTVGAGTPATQAAGLSGFIAGVAGAGVGTGASGAYGGGVGAPAYGVSNPGPNVAAPGIPGIYPGSGGNGSSTNGSGGKGADGLIIIDM